MKPKTVAQADVLIHTAVRDTGKTEERGMGEDYMWLKLLERQTSLLL